MSKCLSIKGKWLPLMLMAVLLMLLTGTVAFGIQNSQTVLSVPVGLEASQGADLSVPVNLTSDGTVAGLQFDLTYDSAILTFQDSVIAGDYAQGFTATANQISADKVRVILVNTTGLRITAGTGPVVSIPFTVTGVPGQTCSLALSDIVLSDSVGNEIDLGNNIPGSFKVTAANPGFLVKDAEGSPGDIVEVSVDLTSDGNVAGLQFDLGFDKTLLAYQGDAVGDLTGGFSVTANQIAADKVRVIIVNYDNASIAAGTGSVVKLTFQVAAGASAGQTCDLELSGFVLSDSNGDDITPVDLTNGTFTVQSQVLATISGTVTTSDGQGDLTQASVQLKAGANVVATTNPSAAGSYNFSNVAAGTYTIEASLSSYNTGTIGPFAVAAGAAVTGKNIQLVKTSGGDSLALSVPTNLTGLPGYTLEVPVSLTSNGSVAGLQFDLGYDPALLTYQDEAAGDLTGGFSVTANLVAANKVRVIIVNFDNSSIAAGTGLVAKLNFQVADNAPVGQTCDLEFSEVALSDSSGEPILGCVLYDGQFTVAGQVVPAAISGTVSTSDGQGDLTQASVKLKNGTNVITTTNPSAAGSYSFSNVPAGTYTIEASLTGYDTGTTASFTVTAGAVITGKNIQLVKTSSGGGGGGGGGITKYTISGKVSVDSGSPDLTKASVQRKQNGQNAGSAVNPNSDGSYTIGGVPAGAYTIEVSLAGYISGTIPEFSVAADVTGKDIRLIKDDTAKCTFPDVPAAHWAINEIITLCSKGIINGYPDHYFRPENNITRAEFTKMIVGVMGLTPKTENMPTYKDVAVGTWYYGYVEAAVAVGLVKGDETGNFRPDAQITRQEIAVILVRAMGKEGQALAVAGQATSFADDQSIDDWARGYVSIASQEGLIKGYEDKTFKPDNNATRAEACAMLYRFLNK